MNRVVQNDNHFRKNENQHKFMSILSLRNVVKRYHNHTAVNDVTFDIPNGSIFGLLGPNGAGKTSLIRIITGITGADSGEIVLDGNVVTKMNVADIGYLPEERGLYKKMKVGEQLLYLAQLKEMSLKEAKDAINYWFEKFETQDWWNKKIEELSKGMQQKIQFIATVMHDPKLIILDEPFTGLDPLNTNLIKDEIYNLNQQGKSIIFSTHRMEQVEEICRDIVLINQGKVILEGKVGDVKESFKQNKYSISYDGQFPSQLDNSHFNLISNQNKELIIQAKPGYDSNVLLGDLIKSGVHILSFKEILPSLNEIFIQKVKS